MDRQSIETRRFFLSLDLRNTFPGNKPCAVSLSEMQAEILAYDGWRSRMNTKSVVPNLLARLGLFFVLIIVISGCAKKAQDPSTGYGPNPNLPEPDQSLIPVLNAPDATG